MKEFISFGVEVIRQEGAVRYVPMCTYKTFFGIRKEYVGLNGKLVKKIKNAVAYSSSIDAKAVAEMAETNRKMQNAVKRLKRQT